MQLQHSSETQMRHGVVYERIDVMIISSPQEVQWGRASLHGFLQYFLSGVFIPPFWSSTLLVMRGTKSVISDLVTGHFDKGILG